MPKKPDYTIEGDKMQKTVTVKMDGFHHDMSEVNRLIQDKWHVVSCQPIDNHNYQYVLEKGVNDESD